MRGAVRSALPNSLPRAGPRTPERSHWNEEGETMTSKRDWEILPNSAAGEDRLFFDEAEWQLVEAATARIIPTDDDPGAREANVVRFIDRYLSGVDYVYASADGSGFL